MAKQDNRPDRTRRLVITGFFAGIAAGMTAWLRSGRAADAAAWPKDAFTQKTEAGAIKALYGKDAEASDQVKLDAPEIAENGAVVPIAVSSALPKRDLDRHPGFRESFSTGGDLQDSPRHFGNGGEPA